MFAQRITKTKPSKMDVAKCIAQNALEIARVPGAQTQQIIWNLTAKRWLVKFALFGELNTANSPFMMSRYLLNI